jgi:hypothetical protein
MRRIKVDDFRDRYCSRCKRPLSDIGVWAPVEETKPWSKTETWTVAKPLCRSCYTFADMQKCDVTLMCASCGFKAPMPEWLANRQVPWTPKTSYDYGAWTCSANCYAKHKRKAQRQKQLTCEACHETFATTRTDARFCSNACRQWTYRRRHGQPSEANNTTPHQDELRE